MIQTHIASISISKTEQKACCTLYPHIKKELDTVSPGKLLFRFSININLYLSSTFLDTFIPSLTFFHQIISPLREVIINPAFVFAESSMFLI